MPKYKEMTQTDCKSCVMERFTYSCAAFKYAPEQYCWVKSTDNGMVARGVAAFCRNHHLVHYHYVHDFSCTNRTRDTDLDAEYSAWVQTARRSTDYWMPAVGQAWVRDVMALFYAHGNGTQVLCEDVDFWSNSLVCTRTGDVVDNNPCVEVERGCVGAGAAANMRADPTADSEVAYNSDILIYRPAPPDTKHAFEKTNDTPAPAVSVCFTKKKRNRNANTCRKTRLGIEADVEDIIRATLHGCTTIPSTVRHDAETELLAAIESYEKWKDLPWAPLPQIIARLLSCTNTTADYKPVHDIRRFGYYKSLIMHVGHIVAWSGKAHAGLCTFHTLKPSQPVWHPTIPTLRKIVTGAMWIMGTVGLKTTIVDRVKVGGYAEGRLETVLPLDPVLIGAVKVYAEQQAAADHARGGQKRGDDTRVHYRRCKKDRFSESSAFPSTRKPHHTTSHEDIGMIGKGIDMKYVSEGSRLVENSIEYLSKTALEGEGESQATAVRLLQELVEFKLWHDTHRLQHEAMHLARVEAEKLSL